MYAAKDRGRNNFQFFTRELNRQADERLRLEAAMRDALERAEGGFEVHYQPKVDHRRRIVGARRWRAGFTPSWGRWGLTGSFPSPRKRG